MDNDFCVDCLNILKSYMTLKQIPKNTILWHDKATETKAFLIQKGHVKVFKTLPNGKEITIFLFGPKKFFGFLPFLDEGKYPAGVKTVTDIEALVIDRKTFRQSIKENPILSEMLIKSLAQKLRTALDATERFAITNPIHKISSFFLSLNFEQKSKYNIITMPFSSKECSELLAITPETFSRSVTFLKNKKIIKKLERGVFQILDLKQLEDFSASFSF